MSEPQTTAKVIIHTVKGRIDVELWAKEKPAQVRRFLEACEKGLLVGESLNEWSRSGDYLMLSLVDDSDSGAGVPLEHNARIRWRTGSLGWDSGQKRWFITLAPLLGEDQKVVIGKIVDDSIYSLRKIRDESEVGSDGKLLYPATIRKVEVTIPYFTDLRASVGSKPAVKPTLPSKKVSKVRISFDDEDDDEDALQPVKRMKIKMPAAISDRQPTERVSTRPESDVHQEKNDEESDNGQESEPETPSQTGMESTVSNREQETLKMLALFEQKTKDKNILNR